MKIRALLAAPLALALSGCLSTIAGVDEDASVDARLGRMMAGESWVQGAELDAALAEAARHPLGSMRNPVRASAPAGQRAYLARLRCADGSSPTYERSGNLGDGVYGNIVDNYVVTCSGRQSVSVVMDMYHSGYVEDRAVPGFTIAGR